MQQQLYQYINDPSQQQTLHSLQQTQKKTIQYTDAQNQTQQDPNVILIPGTDGQVLATEGIDVQWQYVQTKHIADDQITNSKLAANSVTSDKIAPGTIIPSDVGPGSVAHQILATNSATTGTEWKLLGDDNIAVNSIGLDKINSVTITDDYKVLTSLSGAKQWDLIDYTSTIFADQTLKSNSIVGFAELQIGSTPSTFYYTKFTSTGSQYLRNGSSNIAFISSANYDTYLASQYMSDVNDNGTLIDLSKYYSTGAIEFPSTTNSLINSVGNKAAITREYLKAETAIAGGTQYYTLTNPTANTPTWSLLTKENCDSEFIDQNLTTADSVIFNNISCGSDLKKTEANVDGFRFTMGTTAPEQFFYTDWVLDATTSNGYFDWKLYDNGVLSNILSMKMSGAVSINSQTTSLINSVGNKAVITREYLKAETAIAGGTQYYTLTNPTANTPTWSLLTKENCDSSFANQNLATTSNVGFGNITCQTAGNTQFNLDSTTTATVYTYFGKLSNPNNYYYNAYTDQNFISYFAYSGSVYQAFNVMGNTGVITHNVIPSLNGGNFSDGYVVADAENGYNISTITSNGKQVHKFRGNTGFTDSTYVFQVIDNDNELSNGGKFNITKSGMVEIQTYEGASNPNALVIQTHDVSNVLTGFFPFKVNNRGACYSFNNGTYVTPTNVMMVAKGNDEDNITFKQFQVSNTGQIYCSYSGALVGGGTDSVFEVYDYDTSTSKFQVQKNGDVFLQGAVAVTSDSRLKTNIQLLKSSHLDDILNLNIYTYQYKHNQHEVQLGVIAQDIEQNLQFACAKKIHEQGYVCQDNNCSCNQGYYDDYFKNHNCQLKENGSKQSGSTCECKKHFRSVDYSKLGIYNIKAFQEFYTQKYIPAQQKIDELQSNNKEQTACIQALEQRIKKLEDLVANSLKIQ